MSPYLIKELYQQIKRIISRPITLIDTRGVAYAEASDHPKIKQFILKEAPTREKSSIGIEGQPTLRAVPIFDEHKLVLLVVSELTDEDIQTIQILVSLGELIIQQFLTVHQPQPDAVDLLMTRIIHRSRTIEAEELEQQMAALGYRLDVQRVAITFELIGFWENYLQTVGQPLGEKKNLIAAKKHDIETVLTSFFSRNQDNIVGYIGNDRFLVFKDLSHTDFDQFTRLFTDRYQEIVGPLKNIHIQDITVGIGSPTFSAGGLLASAQEAWQVVEVGRKLRGPNTVYLLNRLGVLPLLISDNLEQKKRYARQLLGGLFAEPELLETLEVFLKANLNLTQASELLNVHRNTVIYRLDKISRLSKDPRIFSEAVELELALHIAKIFPLETGQDTKK